MHTAGHTRLAIAMMSAAALCGAAGVAWACTDDSCVPSWRIASAAYDCGGRAQINPSNDTRINLVLLMRSLHGTTEKNASRPGSLFDGQSFGQTFMSWPGLRAAFWPEPPSTPEPAAPQLSAFESQLTQEHDLPAAERVALAQLYTKMQSAPIIWDAKMDASITSSPGHEYLAYIKAANAFYASDWAAARSGFASLTHAHDKWVAETASYMPIRIGLRAAVANASGQYGDFEAAKVDAKPVAEARAGITAYLRAYPDGLYADSANGLIRRVLWLEGNKAELARIYEGLLTATPAESEDAADLAEEIDIILLNSGDDSQADTGVTGTSQTPLLLAVLDLKHMRQDQAGKALPLSGADLAAQVGQFAGRADLYGFLVATRAFYAGEAPKATLALIPDARHATGYTPLAFSRQVLRGQALMRAHDPNESGFWRDLLGGAGTLYQRPLVELGLAVSWQHSGNLAQVFAPHSPITDSKTREILLQTMASPEILRADANDTTRPAHERAIARFTLLDKDLSRGAYAAFGRDAALVPADAISDGSIYDFPDQEHVPEGMFVRGKWSGSFACPSLSQTAKSLARNPADSKAMLCLGEFWRLNGFDRFSLFTAGKEADALGNGPDQFAGTPMARDAIYAAIIADRSASPDIRAYALYRAVMCYAPSGSNSCAGADRDRSAPDKTDTPKDRSKAWFLELKHSYPNSPWAKKLQYYW